DADMAAHHADIAVLLVELAGDEDQTAVAPDAPGPHRPTLLFGKVEHLVVVEVEGDASGQDVVDLPVGSSRMTSPSGRTVTARECGASSSTLTLVRPKLTTVP